MATDRQLRVALLVLGLAAGACTSADPATQLDATVPNESTVEPASPASSSSQPAASAGTDTATTVTTSASASTAPRPKRFETESAEVLFDPEVMHTFAIDVAPDLLTELDADPTAEEYVEGSLTFAGETVGPIGVRYKGSLGAFVGCTDGPDPLVPTGAKSCTRLSMKLKMNWLQKDDTFYGVKKVQLHAQNSDPSNMHERLGYWLFREMGVPAPRSTHARVELNGAFVGVFALTEQIDGRFTRAYFDDGSGNLYKEVWPFDGDGTPRDPADFIDGLKTNEDDSPTADLIVAFADELDQAAPGTELDVISKWIDIDLFIRTMVVDRAIKHDDGPLRGNCFEGCEPHNFYWYENPTSGKLTLIPWDLDNAFINLGATDELINAAAIADPFGEITNDCQIFRFGALDLPQKSAACDPLIGPISELTDEFDAVRAELVAGPFSKERIDDRLATWSAQIEQSIADAAATHDDALSVDAWRAAMAELMADIDAARSTDGR